MPDVPADGRYHALDWFPMQALRCRRPDVEDVGAFDVARSFERPGADEFFSMDSRMKIVKEWSPELS